MRYILAGHIRTVHNPISGEAWGIPEKKKGERMNKLIVQMAAGIGLAAGVSATPPNVVSIALTPSQEPCEARVEYEVDGPGVATFQFKTNNVDICHSEIVRTVTGNIGAYLPQAGTYQFTWHAWRDVLPQLITNLTVEITTWETNDLPAYCAVNLVSTNNLVLWYAKETEIPFGVNHSWWKKDWLLMRKIAATPEGQTEIQGEQGTTSGREAVHSVSITKPFYMGVFPVTQRQWGMVWDSTTTPNNAPSNFNNKEVYEERPVEKVAYTHIRGATNADVNVNINWPLTGHKVAPDSFMGKLREKTGGILEFDLPTDSQWEHACRSGPNGEWYNRAWNNGVPQAVVNNVDPTLDLLGRYKRNGGYVENPPGTFTSAPANSTDANGTAKVGSYLPGAWGLYDMHGNVWEICLDWLVEAGADASRVGADPNGPLSHSGGSRMCRGGSWNYDAGDCRAARRGTIGHASTTTEHGFRIVAPAEVLVAP